MNQFEKWVIAYRPRNGKKVILDDLTTPFRTIKNTWRYWAGDPHLVENEQGVYVFAELYDRVLRKGVIGYSEISANGASPWKVVLKQPCHLSYPHIVRKGEDYYMIPESYMANEISVFKAVSFPDRWKKIKVLKKDFCAVDSTLFHLGNKRFLMTLQFYEDRERLMFFPLEKDGLKEPGISVRENDPNARPAGKFFEWNGKQIRPSQDCTESYGCALNFNEVQKVSETEYQETLLKKLQPADLSTDLDFVPKGLHTYNTSPSYEVVDLKGYETDLLFYIVRPVWFIWRRVKRLFGR